MASVFNGIRAVLLDAGNTLVHLDYHELARILASRGLPVDPQAVHEAEHQGRRSVEIALQQAPEGTDLSRMYAYFGAILRALGATEEQVSPLVEAIRASDRREGLWRVVPPGTHEALETLRKRGHVVGVISNSDGRLASLLAHHGLTPLLDFAIDSHVVGFEKPDPRIFRLGLEKAGVEGEQAVYVGDLYTVDVVGAGQVGMTGILVDPLQLDDHDCPKIRSVAELPHRVAP